MVVIVFWSCPKAVTGDVGPTQQCTNHADQVAMIEMRIYQWSPAAYHAHGGGAWTIVRHFVERLRSKERIDLVDEVRNQQCEWVPDTVPIEWQDNSSPYIEYDSSMEDAREYLESKGRKLEFSRPFLDGAEERNNQLAQRSKEVKAKPPAQPTGGSVPRAPKPPL
eukprot:3505450-Pyramimonas_sp.AAC.1